MANSAFEIKFKPPFRTISGRFAKANKKLLNDQRDGMRTEGRRMVVLMRDEAPKKTGAFAKRIGFKTFIRGSTAGFRVHMQQPLGKFITEGTSAHTIRPKTKKALFWEGAAHPVAMVRHPGTKANKFPGRAFRRWLPGARGWIKTVSTRYTRTIAGAG